MNGACGKISLALLAPRGRHDLHQLSEHAVKDIPTCGISIQSKRALSVKADHAEQGQVEIEPSKTGRRVAATGPSAAGVGVANFSFNRTRCCSFWVERGSNHRIKYPARQSR